MSPDLVRVVGVTLMEGFDWARLELRMSNNSKGKSVAGRIMIVNRSGNGKLNVMNMVD